MQTLLGYLLVDPSGRFYWHGPGMRRVPREMDMPRTLWADRKDAVRVAKALKQSLGIDVRPAPVRAA